MDPLKDFIDFEEFLVCYNHIRAIVFNTTLAHTLGYKY
jgi:hypothetical protein